MSKKDQDGPSLFKSNPCWSCQAAQPLRIAYLYVKKVGGGISDEQVLKMIKELEEKASARCDQLGKQLQCNNLPQK